MHQSAERSESSEALRGEVRCGAVRRGGETGQRPVEIGPGVDFVQLAGADDRVDDGGVVAGVGVTDEEPVAKAELGGTNLALDGIIIDLDVTVARLGEEAELGPTGEAVVDGLGEVALGKDRGIRVCPEKALMELQEEWDGVLGAAKSAGYGVEVPGLGLDLVELAEENKERGGAVVATLEGLHEAAASMGHACGPDDRMTRQGVEGGVVGAEAVGLEDSLETVQQLLGRGVATGFVKLEDDDLLFRE